MSTSLQAVRAVTNRIGCRMLVWASGSHVEPRLSENIGIPHLVALVACSRPEARFAWLPVGLQLSLALVANHWHYG